MIGIRYTPPEGKIPVLYEGNGFLVVEKPAGLLSVPGRGPHHADCLETRLRRRFTEADGPMTVHRLDMETSGVMVVALDRPCHRALSQQFAQRQVAKSYQAIVQGCPTEAAGVIELALRLDLDNRPLQMVDPELGKPARTDWRLIESGDDWARLELVPHTGRTHQLRIHLAHGLGHSIRGDTLYGDAATAPRMQLHAASLSFTDPVGGKRLRFDSNVPF